MKAKTIKGNSTEEIKSALQQSMNDEFKPTLAIMFISIKQDRKAVSEILHNEGIDILGATSCGEFINGCHSDGAAVILLLDLPRDTYTILLKTLRTELLVKPQLKLQNQHYKNSNNLHLLFAVLVYQPKMV
jgi:hypothetical protein